MGVTHILFLGLDNVAPSRAAALLGGFGVRAMFRYLQRVASLATGITITFALVVVSCLSSRIELLYGSQFETHGYVLKWYALVYVLISLRLLPSAALPALEVSGPIFTLYMAGALFTLSTATIGVRYFGLLGALDVMVATQVILQTTCALGIGHSVRSLPEYSNAY